MLTILESLNYFLVKMGSNERNDVKTNLRKREFPFCVNEALSKAEELLCISSTISNRQVLLKQTELINEIISEFVFNEDRRNMKKKLSRIQELELMQIICDYMVYDGKMLNRSTLNSLFMAIFQPPERKRFLINLVSLAISVRNVPVLMATSVFLQQHGYTSPYSFDFIKKLIIELSLLMSVDPSSVLDLPKINLVFAANVLTRIAETYADGKPPPPFVTNIVVHWLKNPRICITSLITGNQPHIPGTMLIPPNTPYHPLIKWRIRSQLESISNPIYIYLEELIIDCLCTKYKTSSLIHNNIISTQDLLSIISSIGSSQFPERQKDSIESLVKIIRVALMSNTLSGSKQDLRRHLQGLPYNEALDVLVQDMVIVP